MAGLASRQMLLHVLCLRPAVVQLGQQKNQIDLTVNYVLNLLPSFCAYTIFVSPVFLCKYMSGLLTFSPVFVKRPGHRNLFLFTYKNKKKKKLNVYGVILNCT